MTNSSPLVAALVYDGFYAFEFQLIAEVFGLDRPELEPDWYRFMVCGPKSRARAKDGFTTVSVTSGLGALKTADLVVIPGWPKDATPSQALLNALIEAQTSGTRLASICSGAFLLAHTGLLNGKRATTHWRYTDEFRANFTQVDLEPDVLYIDEGNVLTSAGSAAGLDLLLHIIRKDKGTDAANSVARRLVIPAHRQGGQRQYVETPVASERNHNLSDVMDQVRSDLSAPWTLRRMANECAMSERTFCRLFVKVSGVSPGYWLIEERVSAAKKLLETTSARLEDIADQTGFGTLNNFTRRFKIHVGANPSAYRRNFSTQGEEQ